MRVAIVTFPGSNCDYDCYKAAREVLGAEARYVWHGGRELGDPDVVFLPGGFSYGDYLRAGAIARFSPIMEEVQRFAADGGPVLGICNGFQILCEAGLLPGALVRNESLRFRGRTAHVRVENAATPFTSAYTERQVLRVPIAHGEGNYVADPATLDRLDAEHRVAFRYVDASGQATAEANPNGSMRNIAGIVNEAGNVLGLMPHPERAVEALLGSTDGRGVFDSLREYVGGLSSASGSGSGSADRGAGTASAGRGAASHSDLRGPRPSASSGQRHSVAAPRIADPDPDPESDGVR